MPMHAAGFLLTVALVAGSTGAGSALAQTGTPAVAASAAPADEGTPPGAVRECPYIASIASSDGSDYAVTFESSKPVTATIAIRLYAGDHDYLVTLPGVALDNDRATGSSMSHRSKPIHLRKPAGLDVFAASMYATLQTPVSAVCDVKNIDVDAPQMSPLARKVAPGFGALAEGVDLTAADATHFACTNPFANAMPTHAMQPIYPHVFADGIAKIEITLASDGSVTGASVYKSTGNGALDESALEAAKGSAYRPGLNDCKPVAGSYIFTAQFQR